MYKVLVTGSRDWTDWLLLYTVLQELEIPAVITKRRAAGLGGRTIAHEAVTLIHGGAKGADQYAKGEALRLGWEVHEERPDYVTFGHTAPFIRNRAMVMLRPHICIAFIKDHSSGSEHCLELAREAGIETRVYRDPPENEIVFD